jgi:hypothetical protein
MSITKKYLAVIVVFLLLVLTAMTTRADGVDTNGITVAPYHPFTINVEGGTTGLGGGANWRFWDHLGIGGTFDYFSFYYSPMIGGIGFNSHLRLMSEPATLNIYPWKDHSFHISVGALFNQNQLTGSRTGTVDIDGTPYTGTVTMEVRQQVVNPYLSIGGNLYFDRGHHVSLGTELGVFYTGEPRVSVNAPGAPPEAVQGLENEIRHYARKAEFWPLLKLSLNYSF